MRPFDHAHVIASALELTAKVKLILEKLLAGETCEQILGTYPRLTREGNQAAFAFAAEALRADVLNPIS